ncbi:hypothetical protein [Streptomyces sp. NBC_00467]|uniref:hypothetical protein n=1 Tax=Streptomyces sp. NBC_00467 TaxID=2975752 RepID=UPI003FA7B20F
MLADRGEAIADLAVLRDQAGVFGSVASTSTAWRLLADTEERALSSLRSARAQAREVAWLKAAEHGEGIPAVRAAGRVLPGLVLDLDATLVTCHTIQPLSLLVDQSADLHWLCHRASTNRRDVYSYPIGP